MKINEILSEKKSPSKPRDPNFKTLQAKRTSGAAGAHRDKKKEQKQGYEKHKQKVAEAQSEGEATLAKIAASGDEGYEMIEDGLNGLLGGEAEIMLQDMYDDVSREYRLHPDDDHEEIVDRMMDYIDKDYGVAEAGYWGGGGRRRDPDDWDEGNTEPPNNFAIYINGKKWKVFPGRGRYADDEKEMKQYYDLKAWCQRKSEATGKKWEVSRTGEAPTAESIAEKAPPGFKGTVKAMKKHKDIDNPFALAWSMKNKGYKSHKKADGSDK